MKLAVLTGGGDCPGLNAAIRAVVRRAAAFGHEVIGIRKGWKGFLEEEYEPLTPEKTRGLLYQGGTILGTSRTNPYKDDATLKKFKKSLQSSGVDAILAIGGEDTLGVAARLSKEAVPVVGIPKTIDNDLEETDFTIGFQTAVSIATEAIDRIQTTAESHNRVMVVEVMGRHVGWLATYAGLAAGADVILIPERPFEMREICDVIQERAGRGRQFSIVVVAEGAKMKGKSEEGMILSSQKRDEFGHVQLGGIGSLLTQEIGRMTGFDSRVTVLGHIQRGGVPVAADRILASRLGVFAVDSVHQKKFGLMAALQGNQIVGVPLSKIEGRLKKVDPAIYAIAEVFFG